MDVLGAGQRSGGDRGARGVPGTATLTEDGMARQAVSESGVGGYNESVAAGVPVDGVGGVS